MDNPIVHALYTCFAYTMNNVSTLCAVILFIMQFIILAPKAWAVLTRKRRTK